MQVTYNFQNRFQTAETDFFGFQIEKRDLMIDLVCFIALSKEPMKSFAQDFFDNLDKIFQGNIIKAEDLYTAIKGIEENSSSIEKISLLQYLYDRNKARNTLKKTNDEINEIEARDKSNAKYHYSTISLSGTHTPLISDVSRVNYAGNYRVLAILADGITNATKGEIHINDNPNILAFTGMQMAQYFTREFPKEFEKQYPDINEVNKEQIESVIKSVIDSAIAKFKQEQTLLDDKEISIPNLENQKLNFGTTFVAVIDCGDSLALIGVGDSKIMATDSQGVIETSKNTIVDNGGSITDGIGFSIDEDANYSPDLPNLISIGILKKAEMERIIMHTDGFSTKINPYLLGRKAMLTPKNQLIYLTKMCPQSDDGTAIVLDLQQD